MDNKELQFTSHFPRNLDLIQNNTLPQFSNSQIGSLREKISSNRYDHFNRLQTLNNVKNAFYHFFNQSYIEIIRILGNLNLSLRFKLNISKLSVKLYKSIKKYGNYRCSKYLTPISIYIFCLQNHIFINLKELLMYSNIKRKDFLRCITIILTKFPKTHNKFKQKEFRIKTIVNILFGIFTNFNLPKEFFSLSIKNLEKNFLKFEHKKNTTLTSLIYRITIRELHYYSFGLDALICRFLGIAQSNLEKNLPKIERVI